MPSGKKSARFLLVFESFESLEDPRQIGKVVHSLRAILLIVFGAVLSGVDDWDGMAAWAQDHKDWIRKYCDDIKGLPSADTLRRVMERLRPETFTRCFEAWTRSLVKHFRGKHLAVDGKAVAGAIDPENPTVPLYMLHVWAVDQRVLLAARSIDGAPAEPRELRKVIELLDIEGATLTGDANLTTAETTRAIRAGKGHYLFALKGNRGPQYDEVHAVFERKLKSRTQQDRPTAHTEHALGHGRTERRVAMALRADHFPRTSALFAGLRSVLRIERTRRTAQGVSVEVAYFVSSRGPHATRLARYVRAHWKVENDLHYTLDVVLHEDACPVPKGNAAIHLALIRRSALMQLKRDSSVKLSIVNKRRKADRNDSFREHLLSLEGA